MNLSALQKLYRSFRTSGKLIIDGSRAWVPVDAKIARAEPAVVKRPSPIQVVERTTPAPPVTVEPMAMVAVPRATPRVTDEPNVRATVRARSVAVKPPRRPAPPTQSEHDFSSNIRQPRRTFKHVVGMADTKQRLLRAAHDVLMDDDGNVEPRNGILLFGEPGNGKTLFAEALAGELALPFLQIAFGDTASKWINDTPEKIKAVFRTASETGACVLFIDEIDSFLKPRDGGANVHSMDRDVVNTMLTEIVNLRGSTVILVAATNFIEQLDTAGIREGRFDYKIEIPPPDLKARVNLIGHSICKNLGPKTVARATAEALASRWDGFSASRLSALGGQLREMHRDGQFSGLVTFDVAMQAMRLLQGRRGRLPEMVKAVDDIIMPMASRNVLRDLAYRMKKVHRLEQMGGSLPRGLLFYGPPGTGKTQAAMALAKASGYAFLKTTGADLIARPDSWERLVREASDIRPAIVFLDEADDILTDRRYSNVATLTNRILTTLDGASGRIRDVIFIAATNHQDRMDPAAVRGGRFSEKVRFDVPERADMERYVSATLWRIANGQYSLERDILRQCMVVLAGRSIADADAVIAESVNRAATRAIRENVAEIRSADVVAAARSVLDDRIADA
ncbi:AAA family ATPase [Trinickia violacea]|uniref:AAA family ATPase n=2 Tax=Trinickia violacea TaxID=2571746 RepID=A0A4P8J0P4_9BURK|nr:AAA family ATPase [Trinickia violacea]